MEFKTILTSLMKERGVTLSQLAKDTKISKSSLHGFLNGAEPSLSKVQALAKYFGVSMDFITTGEESDPIGQLLKVDVHKGTYEVTIKRLVRKDSRE
ncbi:MAG: helix-turn-helix domain-containing protein [Bacteriovoracaceae bacterium]|nr:helix-turn-helix domain-containing protein [Bacteriovoracaceae bacterium]